MKEILPNIYAVEVPKNTIKIEFKKRGVYFKSSIESENTLERLVMFNFNAKLLGTVTPTEIDFDVEPLCEVVESYISLKMFKMYDCTSYTNKTEKAFRSSLTAAGITQYDKLVILRKL